MLTPDRVSTVFKKCLFHEGEVASDAFMVEGITQDVVFHRGRVEAYQQEIHDMLAELPDQFKRSGGGGYSFLEAGVDRHGNLWTGVHWVQEQLVLLGIAAAEVKYSWPREAWGNLPCGMPYFTINQ
jgi:hypothetical protein